VKPRLKKEGANALELNNFRPVSNLQFMSKLLEKVVCTQLTNYLEENSILDPAAIGLQTASLYGNSAYQSKG
jgi:hypothetical protein